MTVETLEWPARTAEFMHFDVNANVDPLADPVSVALVAHRTTPSDGDYVSAVWVPGQTWVNQATPVTVRLFVGKDTLTKGQRYDAWVQVSDSPEVPEIFAGTVRAV